MKASLKENNEGFCVVCYQDFNEAKETYDKIGLPMSLACGH